MEAGIYDYSVDVVFINISWFQPDSRDFCKTIIYGAGSKPAVRNAFIMGKLNRTFCSNFSQLNYRLINREFLLSLNYILAGRNICVLTTDRNVSVGVVTGYCIDYAGCYSIIFTYYET